MDTAILTWALAGSVAGFAASAIPGLHVNALAVAFVAVAPHGGEPGVAFLVAALAASPFGLALASTLLGGLSDDNALAGPPALRLAREGRAVEAIALQAWGAMAGILFALPLAVAWRPLLGWLAPRLSDAMPILLVGIVTLLVISEPARPRVHPTRVVVPWSAGGRVLRGSLLRGADGQLRVGRHRVADPHGLLEGARSGETLEARVETRWRTGPFSLFAGLLAALFVLALSGLLGLTALRMGALSPVGLPASALLPLLAGLFAAPALLEAAAHRGRVPRGSLQAPRPPRGELARGAWPGAAVSALLGIAPGVSASHAALLVPRRRDGRDDSERVLVTLSAVNGGGVVFTLLAWHALARARSGALVAAESLATPAQWRHAFPPPDVLHEAISLMVGAVVAFALARLLAGRLQKRLAGRSTARAARVGLGVLAGAVTLTTGAGGLAVLVSATLVGLVPVRLGVRRSHAMGVILVPALLRAFGAT